MTTTNAGEIRQLPSGEYQFEPWAGVRISRACDAAAAWATEHGQQVLMQFNGICCVATPGASGEQVEAAYVEETDRRARAYRASPAYAAAQARDRAEVARCQQQVDAIIAELPTVLNDAQKLVDCLCRLSDAGDRVGVKCDHKAAAEILERAWTRDDCVGMSPETIRANPRLMARYIVGQAIDCLRRHMPPHPMIRTFAEQYLASLA